MCAPPAAGRHALACPVATRRARRAVTVQPTPGTESFRRESRIIGTARRPGVTSLTKQLESPGLRPQNCGRSRWPLHH
jgi:hypothetical protein